MRNIAVFAHVDAGKTTLSEQFLLHSGAVRTPGFVDAGTAHTDRMAVEKRRGISVRSAGASFTWKNEKINLIDTPGHSDFSASAEEALMAPDGAILLISAPEGVQAHTGALFAALRGARIPTLIFLNKMDREGADKDEALRDIRVSLTKDAIPMWDKDALDSALSEKDDALMEKYLEGKEISLNEETALLREMTLKGDAFPVLCGSALQDTGIPQLLDAVLDYLPPPKGNISDPLCALIYAVSHESDGRCAYVRVFSGCLASRDAVDVPGKDGTENGQEKVTLLRTLTPDGKGQDVQKLPAGEIGMVWGLNSFRIGDVIGVGALLPRRICPGTLRTPLLSVRADAGKDQAHALYGALKCLADEDPLLSISFDPARGETTLNVMGRMQLEILEEELQSRFHLSVSFSPPHIIYRETIKAPAEGFVAYTMPKPCWAVMRLLIEPLKIGSGVQYESLVAPRDILPRYQHQVQQALPNALRQGLRGFEVTDIKVTLLEGQYHEIHTHPLDFIVATPMAVMDALDRGGTKLLEPVLEVEFFLPETAVGKVMSDTERMRGIVCRMTRTPRATRLVCRIPAAECVTYSEDLRRITSGRGAMSAKLICYQDAPESAVDVCPRRSVDPRDHAKYILAARSALDGNIFG